MTIPPTLKEILDKFTFIENILELCIVVTHDYLIKNNYVLMKDGQQVDLTQIWTKPMNSIKSIYYKKNFNSLNVESFKTGKNFICYFDENNKPKQTKVELEQLDLKNEQYIDQKIRELYEKYDRKVKAFKQIPVDSGANIPSSSAATNPVNSTFNNSGANIASGCGGTNRVNSTFNDFEIDMISESDQDKMDGGNLDTPENATMKDVIDDEEETIN